MLRRTARFARSHCDIEFLPAPGIRVGGVFHRTTASLTSHCHRIRGRKPSSLDLRLIQLDLSSHQLPDGLDLTTEYERDAFCSTSSRPLHRTIGDLDRTCHAAHLLAQPPFPGLQILSDPTPLKFDSMFRKNIFLLVERSGCRITLR